MEHAMVVPPSLRPPRFIDGPIKPQAGKHSISVGYRAWWNYVACLGRRGGRRCVAHGFVSVAAAPATVGAYLTSLKDSHAPATVRRRLAAIGKMHRFNDLPWNSAHRDIAGPLGGLLREHGRPARKAAALTLAMLRQLVATCDGSNRAAATTPCC